jgi:NADH:ubiquinone oxidoreductase subunit E
MVSVVICVGSSCYVRGSDKVASVLEALIEKESLQGQVELMGTFCMESCSMGVSVRVGNVAEGGAVYRGVRPEDAETFFYDEIMPRVQVVA